MRSLNRLKKVRDIKLTVPLQTMQRLSEQEKENRKTQR
jgi:hypothetical protein